MNTPLDEIEFLARSDHRVEVLDALAERPCDRNDLRVTTGASSPTMGRILADFEDRRWIDRDGRTYELTRLGEFVAERFMDLREAMETEQKLRDVVPWLPREMEGFTVDLFTDATVSYPGPGYPYQPVARVTQLIEGTESMRGFGTTIVKSSNLEAACRAIIDGMEFEFIYSPGVLETIVTWNPEKVAQADACENCTTFVHDELPDSDWCGLGIYDDRVGICCHDVETGMLKAVVDTDSPAALAWAESVYERYQNEARLLDDEALVT
ncbi:helix-turn-helix transcriptional regulator [Haladaptatus salinisoli]|uniref:helix-turn-helix transcriptional regulator n=1 Tax=Haladaptatus salinisoli TaxID=2884876 RepID=UPI001D0A32CD|nr:transcriptional regulator [Haladaptatus salinisoli]